MNGTKQMFVLKKILLYQAGFPDYKKNFLSFYWALVLVTQTYIFKGMLRPSVWYVIALLLLQDVIYGEDTI